MTTTVPIKKRPALYLQPIGKSICRDKICSFRKGLSFAVREDSIRSEVIEGRRWSEEERKGQSVETTTRELTG